MSQAGYTPIQLYYSTTAAAVPVNTNLASGELAINITDGKLYYKDNTGTVKLLAGATAGPAGGSNTQVQFNSSGVLAGSANLTFDGTILTAAGFAGPINGTVGATTANTGAFTSLTATSLVSSGTAASSFTVTSGSAVPLTITNVGTGNSFVVEDSANPDSTPVVINASGQVVVGYTAPLAIGDADTLLQTHRNGSSGLLATRWSSNSFGPYLNLGKSRGADVGTYAIVQSGDTLGTIQFCGDDGTDLVSTAAQIRAEVDGTPGTNDMPGRLVFSTTADGASSPTERMRIDSVGAVGIGGTASAGENLSVVKNITGSTVGVGIFSGGVVQSDVTNQTRFFNTFARTAASSFTLSNMWHYTATQGTLGAGSAVTNQSGFYADSSLTGATNNYGFYGNIASGSGRWNFYAAGTAVNYFAGNVGIGTTTTTNKLEIGGSGDSIMRLLAAGQANGLEMGQLTADGSSKIFVVNNNFLAVGTNNTERMRITSAGNVGIATTSPGSALDVKGTLRLSGSSSGYVGLAPAAAAGSTTYTLPSTDGSSGQFLSTNGSGTLSWATGGGGGSSQWTTTGSDIYYTTGNVGFNTTSPSYKIDAFGSTTSGSGIVTTLRLKNSGTTGNDGTKILFTAGTSTDGAGIASGGQALNSADLRFYSGGNSERMRLLTTGALCIGTTTATGNIFNVVDGTNGVTNAYIEGQGGNGATSGSYALRVAANMDNANSNTSVIYAQHTNTAGGSPSGGGIITAYGGYGSSGAGNLFKIYSGGSTVGFFNQLLSSGGTLIDFQQASTSQGSISVSGSTVSYNSFCGAHWSQLQQGRGYNPEILRGTIVSSLDELCVWKSLVWTTTEDIPESEGVPAGTSIVQHSTPYLGDLPLGATIEEDGVTKTVADDGNERLPMFKISDTVGDKTVYGVFQVWDAVGDANISALGAFPVRIAAGVTVQRGDLIESNGDGCGKVQADDIIRSSTVCKVTSNTVIESYADGSYTVPCVIYCG